MSDPALAPPSSPPELAGLAHKPAREVKRSWSRIVEDACKAPVVMTSHERAKVVVLSVDRYLELLRAAEQAEEPLSVLQRRFDERLSSLSKPDAAQRLARAAGASPAEIAQMADSPLLAG